MRAINQGIDDLRMMVSCAVRLVQAILVILGSEANDCACGDVSPLAGRDLFV